MKIRNNYNLVKNLMKITVLLCNVENLALQSMNSDKDRVCRMEVCLPVRFETIFNQD